MGILALLAAVSALVLGIVSVDPHVFSALRAAMELAAVCGVFALICAAEAAN